MGATDVRFRTYLRAFFADWLTGMSGPLSVPFALLALYVQSHTQRILYGCLAVLCAAFSSFRVWRAERISVHDRLRELESKVAERPVELFIYPERASCFYVEVKRKTQNDPFVRVGLYIELHLSVENRGWHNATISRFALEIKELNRNYESIIPVQRNQMTVLREQKTAYYSLRQNWLFPPGERTIFAKSARTGILPFYLKDVPNEGVTELHCRLMLVDARTITAAHDFTLKMIGT